MPFGLDPNVLLFSATILAAVIAIAAARRDGQARVVAAVTAAIIGFNESLQKRHSDDLHEIAELENKINNMERELGAFRNYVAALQAFLRLHGLDKDAPQLELRPAIEVRDPHELFRAI